MTNRQKQWLRLTGLLPPEDRGFLPAVEGDERSPLSQKEYLEQKRRDKLLADYYTRISEGDCTAPSDSPLQPTWGKPSTSDEESPMWHNIVRAYEELYD